jgi:predicted nucleotidyltransferase
VQPLTAVEPFLNELVAGFEAALPGQVRSYYLLGSYAEGTAVPPLSDIDLLVVLDDTAMTEAAGTAQHLAQRYAVRSPARLDVTIRREAELPALHAVLRRSLKSGSRLLDGAELRPSLPEVPLQEFRWAVWDGALHFVLNVLRGVERCALPVSYPDPGGEFFGYDRIRIGEWYPPALEQGTKELVAAASRLCSALLAEQAGVQAAGKAAAFRLYTETFDDEWAPLVRDIFERCKLRWRYRVPQGAAEREQLRALCQGMLAFENHALEACRRFFGGATGQGSPARQAEAQARLLRLTGRDQ